MRFSLTVRITKTSAFLLEEKKKKDITLIDVCRWHIIVSCSPNMKKKKRERERVKRFLSQHTVMIGKQMFENIRNGIVPYLLMKKILLSLCNFQFDIISGESCIIIFEFS